LSSKSSELSERKKREEKKTKKKKNEKLEGKYIKKKENIEVNRSRKSHNKKKERPK
jgi:hypothetical protein